MYEYHGWAALFADDCTEILQVFRPWVSGAVDNGVRTLKAVNGQIHIHVSGSSNHPGRQTAHVLALFNELARFEDSHGLLHIFDDEAGEVHAAYRLRDGRVLKVAATAPTETAMRLVVSPDDRDVGYLYLNDHPGPGSQAAELTMPETMRQRLAVVRQSRDDLIARRAWSAQIASQSWWLSGEILSLERQIAYDERRPHAVALDVPMPGGLGFRVDAGVGCSAMWFLELNQRNGRPHTLVVACPVAQLTRVGGLNDEVRIGHELWGQGLDVCGFFEVKNSSWKAKLRQAQANHSAFNAVYWDTVRHFLYLGKDGEIDCLAQSGDYWEVAGDWRTLSRADAYANRDRALPLPEAPLQHWTGPRPAWTRELAGLPALPDEPLE